MKFSQRLIAGVVAVLLSGAINSAMAQGRQSLRGHVPGIVARLQSTGRLPGTMRLNLAIGLPARNEQKLDELIREIYDPTSPNYGHYLTPEQFTEQFGPTEADYRRVADFFEANGFKVTARHPNRVLLDVSGSMADVERVFHVTMRTYRHPVENRNFFAPDTEPAIDLPVPIFHVSGLDDFVRPRPMNLRKLALDNLTRVTPAFGSGPSGLFMGNDFRAAYAPGASLLTGAGQVVALLELDGYFTNDIVQYENQAGLPPVILTNIIVDSFSGAAGGNNTEVALDIEMAVAMAPGLSRIIVYEGPNPGNPTDILNRMATDNLAKQISSSWAIGNDPNADIPYKQFAVQGQSFFQSSGDLGAYYPGITQSADNTNITIVGGTTLKMTGSGVTWSSESAWNWAITSPANNGATGGGISPNFPIPSWQTGINMTTNQGSTTMRNVPDVAMTSDDIFIVADNGQSESVGGTSASAPLWAAYAALINQQAVGAGKPTIGFINPAVYTIGKGTNFIVDFHDTTTGNNTNANRPNKFFAVAGYDLCTGWGTPTGTNLINGLGGLPGALVVTPSLNTFLSGPASGPFTSSTFNLSLSNLGVGSFNWSSSNNAAWLSLSPGSGTLAGGGQTTVTASLNSVASNLLAGTYIATLSFTNQTDNGVQSRQLILQVFEPLIITPASGVKSGGVVGGPFSLTNQNFTLTNAGAASLNWRIANTSSWLNVSSTNGTLAGGAQTATTFSVNPTVSNFVAGTYIATVFFTNQNIGTVQNRKFTLLVGQLIQNGGFETGDFSFWDLNGTGSPYNFVTNGLYIAPHSGTRSAMLGEAGFLDFLSQTVPTIPGQPYWISLWLNSDGTLPNEFSVTWNGNTLYDQASLGNLGWTNLQFVVTATGANTVLQFGAQNDNWYFGLDDVTVKPFVFPSLQTTKTVNHSLKSTWNATTGMVYQVQFKTNLLQPSWVNLGAVITATNVTMTVTNPITSDPRRFYRLQVLP